jgi:hypothetical protein
VVPLFREHETCGQKFVPRSSEEKCKSLEAKLKSMEASPCIPRFAHPDIVIGLTILGYRYEQLRLTDIDEAVGMVR